MDAPGLAARGKQVPNCCNEQADGAAAADVYRTRQLQQPPSEEELRNIDSIKLTRLIEQDDIESYLTTANKVGRDCWPFHLAPHFTGKAQQAYAAVPPDDFKMYDTMKE